MIRQQGAAAGVSAYDLLNRPSTAYFHLETTGVSMDWVNDLTLNADRYVGLSDTAARMVFKRGGGELGLWSGTDLALYSDAGTSSVGNWDGATGNLTMLEDAWAGLSGTAARFSFSRSGSSLSLWDGMDITLYSDAGTSSVGSWDGATGNITLDDGSGDSPSLKFVGGSTDDTISIYLDDWSVTGGSDLNVQLADSAGDSNFEIWDNTPTSVLKLDSNGNVEFVNNGSWIGRGGSNARLEFTSTNTATLYNDLAFNNSTGGVLWIRKSGDVQTDESDIYANTQLGLAADTNVHIFIDADNDASNNRFVISKDAENVNGATELFRVDEAGYVGIGANNPGALTEWGFSTANMQFIDSGTAGATSNAWIYVDVGGTTGYVRIYGSK
jgi:hypothetical protein